MATFIEKVQDRLDLAIAYAVALWLLFITLPGLDPCLYVFEDNGKSYTMYPSKGTVGSCYQTSDGQHYVRTGRGVRKVGKILGERLIARSKGIRRKAIARRVVLVLTVVLMASSLVALAN